MFRWPAARDSPLVLAPAACSALAVALSAGTVAGIPRGHELDWWRGPGGFPPPPGPRRRRALARPGQRRIRAGLSARWRFPAMGSGRQPVSAPASEPATV